MLLFKPIFFSFAAKAYKMFIFERFETELDKFNRGTNGKHVLVFNHTKIFAFNGTIFLYLS